MRLSLLSALAIVFPAGVVHAQQPSATTPSRLEVPAIVTIGLDAYRRAGLDSAIDMWLAGSPFANDAVAKGQVIRGLAPLEMALGRMVGADIIDVVGIGPHVRRVYAVVRLERGPMYGFFECYQTAGGNWIIPALLFNAKAQEILPARYLAG